MKIPHFSNARREALYMGGTIHRFKFQKSSKNLIKNTSEVIRAHRILKYVLQLLDRQAKQAYLRKS